eukprot:g4810.t1
MLYPKVIPPNCSTQMTPPVKQRENSGEQLRLLLSEGVDFNRLVSERPDDVIDALKEKAVTKIGEFESNDPEMLKPLLDNRILTCDFDTPDEPNFAATWTNILQSESKCKTSYDEGWQETMCLVVYCVNIRFAANALGRGILKPLLTKEKTGGSGDEVWDFPSVRAIIEFKWTHWARRYLIGEFILYLGWLLCFVGFMIIYIETNLDHDFQESMDDGQKSLAVFAYFLDIGALIFMCPFLIIEYNSIIYYKWQWVQMWNVLDALAYVFQVVVSFIHFTHVGFRSNFYVTLLAIHCTLLFIKVQYFARVIGPRAAYVETLRTLVYNVRYFLMFIVLSMISAALSFAVLYKWEVDQSEADDDFNESLEDFSSLPRSVVTAYSILLGNFESSYVFDTKNGVAKGIFFLCFQLFMSITVLNLLIAVMTESYTNTMAKEHIMYNRIRAQVIDELELTLPAMFYPEFKPYVHFIVARNVKNNSNTNESEANEESQALAQIADVKQDVRMLRYVLDDLRREIGMIRDFVQSR